MTAPIIGSLWTRRRGRRHLPPSLEIRNVYRLERAALVRYPNGAKATIPLTELRRDYKEGTS